MTPDEFRTAIADAARSRVGEVTDHSWAIADAVLPLLLAALDAAEKHNEALRARLGEAEANADNGWSWAFAFDGMSGHKHTSALAPNERTVFRRDLQRHEDYEPLATPTDGTP